MKRRNIIFLIFILVIFCLGILFRLLTPDTRFTVVSSTITEKPVSIYSPIILTLSRIIPESFVQSCSITSEPKATFTITSNKSDLVVTPASQLSLATTYQVLLTCNNFSTNLLFTTQSETQLSAADLAKLQSERDFSFGQAYTDLFKEQPWREKMPIITDTFEVAYNQNKNIYIAVISIPVNSKLTMDDVKAQIKISLSDIQAPDLPIQYR